MHNHFPTSVYNFTAVRQNKGRSLAEHVAKLEIVEVECKQEI